MKPAIGVFASPSTLSVSKSTATLAIEPSGRTMPPWLVPVCTETLLRPA